MTEIEILELSRKIAHFEKLLQRYRRSQDWHKVNGVTDQLEKLQERYDAEQRRIANEQSMKELEDWYDDEKNRDAYALRVVEEQFSDIVV
jgi:hypothetical protein